MLIGKHLNVRINRNLFHTLRFEILFVLLIGSLFPVSLAGYSPFGQPSAGTTSNSLAGTFSCAIGMVLVLRRFGSYPGTVTAKWILPVLSAFYSILLSIVVLLRIEYSSQILLLSFLATLAARYVIGTLHVRARSPLYYVVPSERTKIVLKLAKTTTHALLSPTLTGLPAGAIVADLHADLDPEWERLLAEAAIAGKPVYHYKQIWEAETGRVQIDHLSENSFGALVPSLVYQKFKRLVDLVASALVLPLVLLILGVCAILIKLDSPGPVFFRQRRMGFRGKIFHVIKLRTMSVSLNGENREESVTQANDRRITKVGRFLRTSRLDELPQIFNIVLGQMSWIGPRPEAVSLSHWYENEIPFYRYRHIVRPGITGWAQINLGHVASLDEINSKLQYDFYYIKNLSYWLDIIIVLRTLRVVLSGFGAK